MGQRKRQGSYRKLTWKRIVRKGQKNGMEQTIQRSEDLTWDEETKKAGSWKVSSVPLTKCSCRHIEERTGVCLHPAPHQQSFLCMHVLLVPVCFMGTPTKQCVTCCFIYWYQMESQDDSATDQDSPVWEAHWTSNHSSAKCTFILSKATLSYTFQLYHCSLTNTQSFFNKRHATCCENWLTYRNSAFLQGT